MKWALALAFIASGIAVVGCSHSDSLDSAAAPVTSTDKQPPPVPGKRPNRAPPLGGPNKGRDIFGGSAGGV